MKRIDLSGYRTIISLVISLVLKGLALKGVIAADGGSAENVNLTTDIFMMLGSAVCDGLALYYKLHSPAPGLLTPEGKTYREMVATGAARPKFDPAIEAAIKALEKAQAPPGHDGKDAVCPIRDVYCPVADAYQRGELEKKPGTVTISDGSTK